jgi:hypothetical protein
MKDAKRRSVVATRRHPSGCLRLCGRPGGVGVFRASAFAALFRRIARRRPRCARGVPAAARVTTTALAEFNPRGRVQRAPRQHGSTRTAVSNARHANTPSSPCASTETSAPHHPSPTSTTRRVPTHSTEILLESTPRSCFRASEAKKSVEWAGLPARSAAW